jgi:uncharacterized protein YbjT (DUF2867 family)
VGKKERFKIKALVTEGTGFIRGNLVRELVKDG